ncbi:MAG: hypothetical protein AB8B50_11150 [Pirellulaceae bacterium]
MKYAFTIASMAALLAVQTGCLTLNTYLNPESPQLDTSLLQAQGYSIPPGGMPTKVAASESGEPSVVLEVRGGENGRHIERIPLPMDRSLFVEDLIQQAQMHDKLGELNISIMRPNQIPGQPPIRLELRTDSKGKANSLGSNYALHPGDHLVVVEDQRSLLERFVKSQFTND